MWKGGGRQECRKDGLVLKNYKLWPYGESSIGNRFSSPCKCLYWHMSTVRSNLEHQNPYGGPSTWCLQSYAVTDVCGCVTQTVILSSTCAHHSFIRKCDCGQVTSPGHFGFLLKWVMCTAWELCGREANWRPSYQGPLSCCCWSANSDREEVVTV